MSLHGNNKWSHATVEHRKAMVDHLFDRGLNIPARALTISGEIDEGWFDVLNAGLSAIELDSPPGEFPAITLRLFSHGGSPYEALAMLGRLRASPCKVDVQVFGCCMSAATILLAGASGKRSISEFATFMWHSAYSSVSEDIAPRVMDAAKQLIREENQWAELMARFTRQSVKYWQKAYRERRDDYLTPSQAVAVGVADEVF